MNTISNNTLRAIAAGCLMLLVVVVSLTVLWGWHTQQYQLISFFLGGAAMKANSAVSFLLVALGFAGIVFKRVNLSITCGLMVMTIAAITVLEYVLNIDRGIDEILFFDPWDSDTPGRMGIGSAISFALAGAILSVHHFYPQTHIGRYDALLSAFLVTPLFVIFCYIFAPTEAIKTPLVGTMALHCCLNFLFYFVALALVTKSKGAAGLLNRNTINARNFRLLFFMVLIIPLCLGSVLNFGVQQHWIGTGIGIAIFCLFSTMIIASALAHHTILLDHWFRRLWHERRRSNQLKNQIHELLEISADSIILFDGDMRVLHANSGSERILGYSRAELQQMSIDQLLSDQSCKDSIVAKDKYTQTEGESSQMVVPERLLLRHKNGAQIPVTATLTRKVLAEQTLVIAVIKSISALDTKIRDLEKQATTDPLTQVSNRSEFENYCSSLASNQARGGREGDQNFCVLMLDIDNFKNVNDTYGHGIGDDVLRHFSQAVKFALREGDKLFRTGGEEFVIISNYLNIDNALAFAERIRLAVKEYPFHDGEHTLHITCSIGVSVINTSKEDIQTAIDAADQAMYQAKKEGKDRCVLSTK
jgi:diguanylate cyclase (GGDEF)-like protein/PAS domain S-box-containing protein